MHRSRGKRFVLCIIRELLLPFIRETEKFKSTSLCQEAVVSIQQLSAWRGARTWKLQPDECSPELTLPQRCCQPSPIALILSSPAAPKEVI